MNNNYPLGADLDSSAPWNEEDIYCPDCGSDKLEISDSGKFRGIKWTNYKCTECGHITNNEPDYD